MNFATMIINKSVSVLFTIRHNSYSKTSQKGRKSQFSAASDVNFSYEEKA